MKDEKTLTYRFNREFPLPFTTTATHVFAGGHAMVMNWMRFDFSDSFREDIIAKINGKDIDLGGLFYIGNSTDKWYHNIDSYYSQDADAEHDCLWFWPDDGENGKNGPILILKMRGWGHLTGHGGGLGIEPEKAMEIQAGTLNFIRDVLRSDMKKTKIVIEGNEVGGNDGQEIEK